MIICDVKLIYRAGRDGQTEKKYSNLSENWKKVSGSNKVRGSSFLFQILSKQLPCVSSFSCRKERPFCKTQRQQNSFVRSQETSDKYGSKAKELSWQLLTDCSKPAIHPKRKGWEEGGSGWRGNPLKWRQIDKSNCHPLSFCVHDKLLFQTPVSHTNGLFFTLNPEKVLLSKSPLPQHHRFSLPCTSCVWI